MPGSLVPIPLFGLGAGGGEPGKGEHRQGLCSSLGQSSNADSSEEFLSAFQGPATPGPFGGAVPVLPVRSSSRLRPVRVLVDAEHDHAAGSPLQDVEAAVVLLDIGGVAKARV
jgi:hypothetical protein